jgi:Uma2 family endonuclease
MAAVPTPLLTADRYLEIERSAREKCQFYRGEMFAMAGASANHNLIVANMIGELRNSLKRSPCRVFASDLRVAIERDQHYVYPDAVVVCGEAEYLDESFDTLLNPTLVVEVLSETTERYDRGLKFAGYRRLPSVQTVVFVSQERPIVEIYSRQGDDQWLLKAYELPADTAGFISHHGIEIPLADLYRGITWPEATDRPETSPSQGLPDGQSRPPERGDA